MAYFKDTIQVTGKHATIMRDGVYLYLPAEIGITDGSLDPNIPIPCYRPYTEVIKANDKFLEYGKLPVTVRHPVSFLNLQDKESFKNGSAEKPELKNNSEYTVIDCLFNLENEALKDYGSGTRQLSCGWEGEFEYTPNGEYKYIQRFKDINHIAIVPNGRAGDICKINDGGLTMLKTEKVKTMFASKGVTLTDAELVMLDALQLDKKHKDDDEEEKEEKEKKDKKQKDAKKKDSEEEKEKEEDEDEEEETKKKKYSDTKKKSKDEDKEEEDAAFEGKETKEEEEEEEKEKKDKKQKDKKGRMSDASIIDSIKKQVVQDFASVLPVMSQFKASEIAGKTPAEIKALFIKKESNTEIQVNDAGLDAIFNLALKNYTNPAWKGAINDSQDNDLATQINNLTFNGGNK